AERNAAWLEKQLLRVPVVSRGPRPWSAGTEILFRGEHVRLQEEYCEGARIICFGNERIRLSAGSADVRHAVERYLWKLAGVELRELVWKLAAANGLRIQRVSVRNQRSRWGSCSRRGTI